MENIFSVFYMAHVTQPRESIKRLKARPGWLWCALPFLHMERQQHRSPPPPRETRSEWSKKTARALFYLSLQPCCWYRDVKWIAAGHSPTIHQRLISIQLHNVRLLLLLLSALLFSSLAARKVLHSLFYAKLDWNCVHLKLEGWIQR